MESKNQLTKELVAEISEFGVHHIVENELLKEIPIFGPLLKILGITKSVSDRILLKKLTLFIERLQSRSPKQISDLMSSLADDQENQKIGGMLIILIDKFDNLDKPKILADTFYKYLTGAMSSSQFLRIGTAVNLAHILDLQDFFAHSLDQQNSDTLLRLIIPGIAEMDPRIQTMYGTSTMKIAPSEIGRILHSVLT